MNKIMIIEDDFKLRMLVNNYLEKWGFATCIPDHFEGIDDLFLQEHPDLVLMDINLPSFDGFYWCSKIRRMSDVPIIFISSRTENMDIVMAMNMGGDDFIQKPFSLEVLVAKINAVLRRVNRKNEEKDTLSIGNLILTISNATLSFNGIEVSLTKNEFQILYLLMKKPGSIVSREEMMRSLWEDEHFIDDNTLTVNITRLRKKFDEIGIKDAIVTKKRLGYMLYESY